MRIRILPDFNRVNTLLRIDIIAYFQRLTLAHSLQLYLQKQKQLEEKLVVHKARNETKLLLEELDELLSCVAEARALGKQIETVADSFKLIEQRAKAHVSAINKLLH